jgi:hypothetical protein
MQSYELALVVDREPADEQMAALSPEALDEAGLVGFETHAGAVLGRTYESVRLLAAGKRGPGGFPAPLSTGQWALYSWAEVSAWFAIHYGTASAGVYDRTLVAADHLIHARRIMAGDKHRDEMLKLVVA